MSKLTHILNAIEQGDVHAADQPLPLVYDELRSLAAQRLADEKPGQTLQATALEHEALEQARRKRSVKHAAAGGASTWTKCRRPIRNKTMTMSWRSMRR